MQFSFQYMSHTKVTIAYATVPYDLWRPEKPGNSHIDRQRHLDYTSQGVFD